MQKQSNSNETVTHRYARQRVPVIWKWICLQRRNLVYNKCRYLLTYESIQDSGASHLPLPCFHQSSCWDSCGPATCHRIQWKKYLLQYYYLIKTTFQVEAFSDWSWQSLVAANHLIRPLPWYEVLRRYLDRRLGHNHPPRPQSSQQTASNASTGHRMDDVMTGGNFTTYRTYLDMIPYLRCLCLRTYRGHLRSGYCDTQTSSHRPHTYTTAPPTPPPPT